eukprot:3808076-Pleurochrysis_carterae.AAC.1
MQFAGGGSWLCHCEAARSKVRRRVLRRARSERMCLRARALSWPRAGRERPSAARRWAWWRRAG